MNINSQMIPLLPPSVVYLSCFVRGMDCYSEWFPIFSIGFFTSNRPTYVPLEELINLVNGFFFSTLDTLVLILAILTGVFGAVAVILLVALIVIRCKRRHQVNGRTVVGTTNEGL